MTDGVRLTLAPDIQGASQHAAVDSSIASAQPDGVQVKTRKRKKRVGSHVGDDGETPPGVGVKKRKERHAPEGGSSTQSVPRDKEKRTESRKRKRPETVESSESTDPPAHDPQDSNALPQIDPELLSSSSNPSTSAFLSAVVAAASAMTETSANQHLQPYQPSPFAPNSPSAQRYLPYLPIQYPCDILQPGHPQQLPNQPFPMSLSAPLSEVSNEDILRALQDLDITKIASVLKTLNDAASAANIPLNPQPEFMGQTLPNTQHLPVPAAQHHPPPSNVFPGQPPMPPRDQRRFVMTLPGPQLVNPNHAHLLATKWLSAGKLAELVAKEGLVYKKGKFSAIEERQLKDAIENYRVVKQLSDKQLHDIIFAKNGKTGETAFWSEITSAVTQRPIIAVYHHVRRGFHPMKQQGKWMDAEDELLKQAVADLGQQWEKVSERVGRMSSDCRDRYRNHISHREVRVSGQWTKEEEDLLTKIVTEMTVDKGGNLDDDVFWGKVSERMENKRGRQQCRIKWTDSLNKTVKNKGQKPRWSQHDAYILVHKIDALSVRDDTEIDWKTLQDPSWNLWSAHSLQRRWLSMKRSVKGYEDMTHPEIMDILRMKKAQVPAPPATPSRKRRVVSSIDVIEAEQPVAGSSACSTSLPEA